MDEATVSIDEKGRIIIPQKLRKKFELKKGAQLSIKAKGKTIVLEPMESVADKYFGAFKIAFWSADVDEFAVGASSAAFK